MHQMIDVRDTINGLNSELSSRHIQKFRHKGVGKIEMAL